MSFPVEAIVTIGIISGLLVGCICGCFCQRDITRYNAQLAAAARVERMARMV